MKKKVFSLMMMLLLAFTGFVRANELTVHDGSATNSYVPVYGFYADAYLKCEMVYPASELSAMSGGEISSLTFGISSPAAEAWTGTFQVFVKEVNDATISDFSGTTGATVVYTGTLDGTGSTMTVNFSSPYTYNGGNLLVGFYLTTTGNYKSISWAGETVNGASVQGYSYTSLGDVIASQRDFLPKTTFTYTGGGGGGTGGGATMEDYLHVKYMDGENEVIDTLNMGVRPAGCWMEPFNFTMYCDTLNYTVTVLDFTPSDGMFSVTGEDLPFQVAPNADVELMMACNGQEADTGVIERQFVAITEGNRAAHIWPVMVELYAPEIPDVWEKAYDFGTIDAGFTYEGIPSQITPTELHNDYTLPFPEIPEGQDAVYKFTVDQDVMISAYVDTTAENGKVAIYTEDFNGEGGPMATNNYTAGAASGGAAGAPFEVQIGEGTSTTGYFPFYTLYNYSIAENLYLATELTEAGVTTAPMTSLSWYATNAPGYAQQGITIWMANVDDAALTTTSHSVTGMTKVYTGAMTPAVGWNEFVFNEGTFSWDGHSNVLIFCQRNNGTWNSTVSWQATSGMNFTCQSYQYQDSGAYDPTVANTMYTATVRPNIIMKGGNREGGEHNRELVTIAPGGYNAVAIPVNFIWAYTENQMILTADEIGTSGNITSIAYKRYSEGSGNPEVRNIDVYMKHVSVDTYASTADWIPVTAADLVFSGNHTFQTTGEDFQAIELQTPFAYNGTDNLMICIDDNTGTTTTRQYWSCHYTTGYNRSMRAWGSSNFDPTAAGAPAGGSSLTGNWAADIQLNIEAGGSSVIPGGEHNYAAGPVIENLPLTPGTYYLVASATQADYTVYINVDEMPCPTIEAEGFAFNPEPADDADEIEPASVTLRWMVPDYATGWRLVFGSTYHPDPNHPQTIMYPEDGSFTTEMANSYTVRNLWNNTNYFWHVEFNNDGCPEGVSSPIWGFTTHLNVPQNLTVVDETVFNDEEVVLNWNAVVDRTYRYYFIYRDGVKVGETTVNQINLTTYTDGPLAYNMNGYTYYVTAVYDEGESAPSNTVIVKVSGRGNVNGHVYEQDGTTGIAGATVTMVGEDEFGVNHTYNFTTNNQGYYSGAVYAGEYNGSASCNGYQTIDEPVQGNPIDITFNQTTSPVDYILDENFDPVCSVIAEYYPDSLDPNSPYVKVYWGCGLPGEEIVEPFETGDFSLFDWQIDPTYPWTITTNNPYEGTYCMKSGGAGVASVVSNMSVTVDIPADGIMSFFGKISSENNYDYGHFYIDGVEKGQYCGAGSWGEKKFDITQGTHTFKWSYTKDSSVNSNDDCFYVDYITFYKRPEPAQPGWHTWCESEFNNAVGSNLTTTPSWAYEYPASFLNTNYAGWQITKVSLFSDNMYSAVGGNYTCRIYTGGTQPAAGTMVSTITVDVPSNQNAWVDWDLTTPVNVTGAEPIWVVWTANTTVSSWPAGCCGDLNELGTWWDGGNGWEHLTYGTWTMRHWFTNRSGRSVAVGTAEVCNANLTAEASPINSSLRTFVKGESIDNAVCANPNAVKGAALSSNDTRSLNHYRVYRTNCYNDGPYTEENTVLLATVWVPDTVYIDVEWADLPAGVYKWGVGAVYEGNRGEMIEAPINWAAPMNITRDVTADNDPNPVPGEEGIRAPWDLLHSFNAAEAGHYGVVTDGNYIYTSNWGYSAAAHNFYKYDMQGNMIEGFEVSGCGTLRGMTFDGQYVYGVANSSTVYCVDLNSHTLITTFTSAYGAMRGITYDAERDGFWVIGNWSGNLTLINRQGAVQFTGPAPTSASDLAYYKDGDNVEHVFCFNNGDNGVYDYNITTNTLGGSVFNFSAVPGFNAGSSGGCHVAEYNGKIAFYGDIQQDPNLIGIYELRDGGGTPGPGPGPSPTPGNNLNQLALPRESETIWSNCLDKDMYILGDSTNYGVTVNVLLNSADSPEGVQVTFTNYNEYEQQTYGGYEVTLDETGFYAFNEFRKGEYKVNVTFDGYEPIEDSVSIWEPTDLRYVMTEIIYGVSDLYVSSTGWAMWGAEGIPGGGQGGQGGGQGGNGGTFSVDFEGNALPEGWTVIDGNNDGYTWCLTSAIPTTWTYYASLTLDWYHSGTNAICSGSYINGVGALNPDEYLVSPQVTLASGSQLSFWVAATDASYPADHFGVFVSDNGTSDWTSVQEWTLTAKKSGLMGGAASRNGEGLRLGNWYNYTVDLSAYAGNKYIAFRHFNCYDQYIMVLDDIALTSGAKDGDRHLEYFKVMCTSIDGEPIFNTDTEHPFCQVATDELVAGEHYLAKVAAVYSTGMSDWSECEWQYIPCENYTGTVNGVEVNGNEISWEYPGGGTGPTPPGQGDTFSVNFDDSQIPSGWTTIDGGSPAGYGWQIGSTKLGSTGNGHNGSTDLVLSQSYDNNYGVVYPDNWLISPAVTLANGSSFSFWACGQDANYAAEHCGVFVSTTGTNPSDFTMVQEWTLSAKGERYRGPRGTRDQGTWREYTVDLSSYAGAGRYIAIRHFNCSDMFYLDVDDVELTSGAKSNRAAWDLMMTFNAAEAGHYGVAYDGNNFYTSNWGYSSAAHNFYKYDLQGNMLEGFEISGCGTLRGITYDGEHFYGVANSSTVYCVDLANHSVVTTFSSAYGAMRGITYDPERDGFWVIGNWSGNLTLIDRAGAIVQTGPAPTSASDLAYYKDENDVEHIYCFNNGTNDVEDWVIGNTSMGGSVFNFSNVPGFASGSSGGCTVGSFNGKIAFIGDIQQDPNLIGIYELRDDNNPGPGPGPQPSGDVIGAMIFADGEWVAEVPYPTNTYTYEGNAEEVCVRIIYNGTNNLPEGNIYYSMSCPECEPFNPAPACDPGEPIHAEVLNATDQVKIWWGNEPQPPMEEWLYYDNGTYATNVGTGDATATIYWATMFPAASLAPYAGTNMTKVAVYENNMNTNPITITVYLGGTTAPGTAYSTKTVTPVGNEFHEVTLDTPVAIDGTQNLWIVCAEQGEHPACACTDTGDANNRWISLNGTTWQDLASAGLPGYGWLLRGFVTNQAKGAMENVAIEVEVPANVATTNMTLSHTEVVSKPADLSFMNRSEIVKYNVYRSTEATGGYTLIGEVTEEAAPNYYEYIDTPETAGTYYYQVKAVYDNGCESAAAQAYDDPSHDYVSAVVTGLSDNEGNVALYPNPTKGNVTIEAAGMSRITVVSVLGQVVYDTEVSADVCTLNMSQFNAGMYMVRVYTENGVTVKRVTVMQ